MNAISQLFGQNAVDQPLAIDAGSPLETITHDRNVEVAFAASIMSGVPLMSVAVVLDGQFDRRQRLRQLALHPCRNRPQWTLPNFLQLRTCIDSHITNEACKKIHKVCPAWFSHAS